MSTHTDQPPKHVSVPYVFTNYMHIVKLVQILNELLQHVSVHVYLLQGEHNANF
jgi:hypothetical protein